MRFLLADSETPEQRNARRAHAGRSSAESYAETLRQLEPGADCDIVRPHEEGSELPAPLEDYHGVFLSGSPLHVYDDTPEVRRQIEFMRAVFRAGTPAFGSCAGLQVAVATAGGEVGKVTRHEAGFARRITLTPDGAGHPMLEGRPPSWDALAIHSDAVKRLPPGATLLAGNALCPIQAVEIRFEGGIFWGVQYHPELALDELAIALRRQAESVVEQGLARTEDDVEHHAGLMDELAAAPDRLDLAWRLGVDEEVTDQARRRRELTNFIAMLRRSS